MGGDGGHVDIHDYGLIADCRTAALVSRAGSIDWCCMPRFDSGALFARLLDADRGGHCSLTVDGAEPRRRYLDDALVLETRFARGEGELRMLDFLAAPSESEQPTIVRLLEGVSGSTRVALELCPRFDYGAVAPWIRGEGCLHTAIGGDDGLLIRSDFPLERLGRHALGADLRIGEGDRAVLCMTFRRPVELDDLGRFDGIDLDCADAWLDATVDWWRTWARSLDRDEIDEGAARSALVLRALSYAETGAIAAAPTTSLPESRDLSGDRNWDYRFSWIRDSVLSVRSLAELGYEEQSDAFRRFIERSAAGHAEDLQILFGVAGERRLGEEEIDDLAGYRGSSPVRVGNDASGQFQLDAYGQIVDQSWRWHLRGNSPDDEYWHFIADLVDAAVERWSEPDRGIWEWRDGARHFVHSKVLAWAAVDRGLRLAEDTGRDAPATWHRAREEIRAAVESRGYDEERGVFVQTFDSTDLDAAVLRLPTLEFVAWDDERMVRTATAIRDDLSFDGLLKRYTADDGMPEEGAFIACSFWLAECLARQGRDEEAREVFDSVAGTANDLGLFSEEYDPVAGRMLGNFPQALSHLAHIEAVLALAGAPAEGSPATPRPAQSSS